MSLKEVVLEIVDEMEKDAGDYKKSNSDMSPGMVLLWARQLRRVCKAAEESFIPSPQAARRVVQGPATLTIEPPDDDPDDLLRGQQSVPCVGGGSNGDHIVLSPMLPKDGSYKMAMNGEVYILKGDGKLHFSATETLASQNAGHPLVPKDKKILLSNP